jgi:hypothetical protein
VTDEERRIRGKRPRFPTRRERSKPISNIPLKNHLYWYFRHVALGCALLTAFLAACSGTGKPPGAPSGANGPQPGLPRHEYPFDSSGRYRTEWVRGSGSGGGASSSAAPTTSTASSSSSSSKRHTVARGDTLSAIGRKYGSSASAIQKANGLSSDLIRPGQLLRIP